MLYIGNADGGSGGDPLNMAQNMTSPFGKILRIDPLAPLQPVRTWGGTYGKAAFVSAAAVSTRSLRAVTPP